MRHLEHGVICVYVGAATRNQSYRKSGQTAGIEQFGQVAPFFDSSTLLRNNWEFPTELLSRMDIRRQHGGTVYNLEDKSKVFFRFGFPDLLQTIGIPTQPLFWSQNRLQLTLIEITELTGIPVNTDLPSFLIFLSILGEKWIFALSKE